MSPISYVLQCPLRLHVIFSKTNHLKLNVQSIQKKKKTTSLMSSNKINPSFPTTFISFLKGLYESHCVKDHQELSKNNVFIWSVFGIPQIYWCFTAFSKSQVNLSGYAAFMVLCLFVFGNGYCTYLTNDGHGPLKCSSSEDLLCH